MLDLIKNNQKHLENQTWIVKDKDLINKIVSKLNKDKLVIISGLRGASKTAAVSNLIKNSNYKNNYFYFNKYLDKTNSINSLESFKQLFELYIKRYEKPSIIIFENSHNIDGFKEFLGEIYSNNKYKIMIVGNDIKISGKTKVEIYTPKIKDIKISFIKKYNLTNILNYGVLQDILLLESDYIKKQYLNLASSDIIFNDIIKTYSIKNYDLYTSTITFLSLFSGFSSLRELNKSINKTTKVSLVTMIEYIDYSIETNIISRMYKYDIKKQKEITSKAKYYFADNGIRNSLSGYNLDKTTLKENLIYNELIKKGYKVNSGINGKFEFSFFARKIPLSQPFPQRDKVNSEGREGDLGQKGVVTSKIKISTLCIHMSEQTKREEIKKEVKKLLKVPFVPSGLSEKKDITEDVEKYLIVQDIKSLKLKKLNYENVEIVEFEEFVNKNLA